MNRSAPPRSASPVDEHEINAILHALKLGRGHDRVTSTNVDTLIDRAAHVGDRQTELLLREWRSTCGDDAAMPSLPARVPPRGAGAP